MNIELSSIREQITAQVSQALSEDIGSGDISAELIPENTMAQAQVITREPGILCGQAWVEEVYKQLDESITFNWLVADGEAIRENQVLFELKGSARILLTGERCALNFLQTLSATATVAHEYAQLVKGTHMKILDTRKTIPGLRLAQKYAVNCGGCHNHRIGLYDAFLIKENHIAACGSIEKAVAAARKNHPDKTLEVEVENLDEYSQALAAGADIIMLDNFSNRDIQAAVKQKTTQCKIEISGGITRTQIPDLAQSGADFISIGALTKHCRALDLSFQLVNT